MICVEIERKLQATVDLDVDETKSRQRRLTLHFEA